MLSEKAAIPINRLTKDDLETALRTRLKNVIATTVMKERQTLISFFDWAIGKEESQLRSSPAENLCTFQENREKKRFRMLEEIEQVLARGGLSDDQVEEYWECLYLDLTQIGEVLEIYRNNARHDFIFPMVTLAAYTGMWRGEILRLEWSDIDYEARLVTARSRKQSRRNVETARVIPIHSDLRAVLKGYHETRPQGQFVICKAGSVIPITKDMAHDHFQRTLRKSRWVRTTSGGKKVCVLGFHTFRHSFASNLAVQGVDQRLIDDMMGHQTEEMRKRYQHLHPKSRQAAIDVLAFSGTKSSKVCSQESHSKNA